MSDLKPFDKKSGGCPICSKNNGNCRYRNDGSLILCMTERSDKHGYKFIGESSDRLWGKFVPATDYQPSDNDRLYQQQKAEYKTKQRQRLQQQQARLEQELSPKVRDQYHRQILDELNLSSKHEKNLLNRGLSDPSLYKSVQKFQKLENIYPTELAGIGKDGQSLNNASEGLLVPIPQNGLIIGCQIRLDDPNDGGKYRFLSTDSKINLGGETPIGEYIPEVIKRPGLGFAEGYIKPHKASEILAQIMVGCAGGRWGYCEKQVKELLEKHYPDRAIPQELYPDAGALRNKNIFLAYKKLNDFLNKLGYTLQVGEWQQHFDKSQPDIDELTNINEIKYISWQEYASQYAGPALPDDSIPHSPLPIPSIKVEEKLEIVGNNGTTLKICDANNIDEEWQAEGKPLLILPKYLDANQITDMIKSWSNALPQQVYLGIRDLRKIASALKIPYYKALSKEELICAIQKTGGDILDKYLGPAHIKIILDSKKTFIIPTLEKIPLCSVYSIYRELNDKIALPAKQFKRNSKSSLWGDEFEEWKENRTFHGDIILKNPKSPYLSDNPKLKNLDLEGKIIAIHSGLETGKTTFALELIDKYPDFNILNIGYRNSLLENTADKYAEKHAVIIHIPKRGIPLIAEYQRYENEPVRASGCLDSLTKMTALLSDEELSKTIIMLDEWDAVLTHLEIGRTLNEKNRIPIQKEFDRILAKCYGVVILSGTMSDKDMDYFKGIKPVIKYKNITDRPKTPLTFILGTGTPNDENILTMKEKDIKGMCDTISILLSMGQNIATFSDSKKFLQALEKFVLDNNPGIFATRIDNDTKSDKNTKQYILKILKKPITLVDDKCNLLTGSPTVESGVDINCGDHFSHIFGFYFGVIGCNGMFQLLKRVRGNIPVTLWVNPWCVKNLSSSLFNEYMWQLKFNEAGYNIEDMTPRDLEHIAIAKNLVKQLDYEKQNIRPCMKWLAEQHNYEVKEVLGETGKADVRGYYAEIEIAEATAIFNAHDKFIKMDDLSNLGDLELHDQYALKKALFLRWSHYSAEEYNHGETPLFNIDNIRIWLKNKKFFNCVATDNDYNNPDLVLIRERGKYNKDRHFISDIKLRYSTVHLLREINAYDLLGQDVYNLNEEWEKHFCKWATSHPARFFALAGRKYDPTKLDEHIKAIVKNKLGWEIDRKTDRIQRPELHQAVLDRYREATEPVVFPTLLTTPTENKEPVEFSISVEPPNIENHRIIYHDILYEGNTNNYHHQTYNYQPVWVMLGEDKPPNFTINYGSHTIQLTSAIEVKISHNYQQETIEIVETISESVHNTDVTVAVQTETVVETTEATAPAVIPVNENYTVEVTQTLTGEYEPCPTLPTYIGAIIWYEDIPYTANRFIGTSLLFINPRDYWSISYDCINRTARIYKEFDHW